MRADLCREDADSRVSSLKERMALLKKRREARGGAGAAQAKGKTANGADHA
jgi:zinc finger protein 830